MAVICSGVIRDPSNNPVPNLRITLRSIGTNATSLDGAEIVVTTGADGSYSFPLQEGRYGVFMDFGERTFVGEVVILDTTIDDTLNQYLINVDFASVIGPALAEFEALRNECLQAVTDAEAQVALATTQAQLAAAQVALATAQVNLATVQADRAETEADRASQITGLDTVEEAVDLAITNEYLTGRTQGDVDAERALKRERFAGSGWEHFGNARNEDSELGDGIRQGLWARYSDSTYANTLMVGLAPSNTAPTIQTQSKFDEGVLNIAGFTVHADQYGNNGNAGSHEGFRCKFPEAPDGRDTYNSTDGTQVRHADAATAFAAETATNQVVTRRVDMWGFEGFLEEVNTGNPFVYRNGLIQSQATTMNGIPTVNGTRPVSYYAVFDGDTTSVGRGVNFFAATAAQQEAMLNDPKNNLYRLEDGRLVQFRVRQRTIAGAGNGDWQNVNPNEGAFAGNPDGNWLLYSQQSFIAPQGDLDTSAPYTSTGSPNGLYTGINSGSGFRHTELQNQGAFTASIAGGSDVPVAVNGECYFLVGGTVSRLNQGAYHPELNSFGSKRLNSTATDLNGANWSANNAINIQATSQAFNQVDAFTNTTDQGAAMASGAIGQTSGRTNDGRLYDAIYADGLGGVVDYRWSANDRSDPKWGAQAKLGCESGEYRGLEGLVRTQFMTGTTSRWNAVGDWGMEIATGNLFLYSLAAETIPQQTFYVYNNADPSINAMFTFRTVLQNDGLRKTITCEVVNNGVPTGTLNDTTGYTLLIAKESGVSVSGNFTRTDLMGSPVNLMSIFPTGFEGGVIVTSGAVNNPTLTRKSLSSNTSIQFTANNGSSWGSASFAINSVNQVAVGEVPATDVQLYPYTADAKKTRRSTNTALLNAQTGQYGVTATASSDVESGGLMFESMLGKVATSTATANGIIQTYPFMVLNLRPRDGNIDPLSGRESQHAPLMLAAPTNDSRGIKYGAHQVNDNGQATLNFIFNELDHNGTDWGDDSRLRVLNGTYTNQNGVTGLLADVDELAIPYGLIKNEV